jgi:predicted enzyme related to lactoylglutathione lyase
LPTQDEAWPTGTPNWVDLAVDDPQAAAAFYGDLLGWSVPDPGPDSGGYLLAFKSDRAAAGIGPKAIADMPSTWSTYFASDDADATAAAVRAAGGSLLMEPFNVMDSGRMFFAAAPDGSTFGVWQAMNHTGAGIYNEPGSYAWNELHSRDLGAAKKFYSAVFGFSYDDAGTDELPYLIAKRPDQADKAGAGVGGMAPATMLPDGAPSMWLTWFAVTSCDDAVARVGDLGGGTLMAPTDSPFGRMAVVSGAQGEVFGVIDLANTTAASAQSDIDIP